MNKTDIVLAISIWIVSFGFFQTSCTPTYDIAPDCLTWLVPDTLRFNLFDMDTKKNLFFSSESAYEPEQLKLFYKSPTSTSTDGLMEISVLVSQNSEEEYFKASISVYRTDTLYLQVSGHSFDTIIYTVKENPLSPCPQRILDTVTFNGEHTEDNAHNKVVHFYRKE